MHVDIEPSWRKVLKNEFEQAYFTDLATKIKQSYLETTVFPPPKLIFNAFTLCPFSKVKVVILGQDPYHGTGQAHGLAFSVPDGVKIPPSLRNIYKELKSDLNLPRGPLGETDGRIPESGNLEHWAKQGVLLLNATLTVLPGQPASHQGLGWEIFTDAVIKTISDKKDHVVFLLWGKFAISKKVLVDQNKHLVLTTPHPSPFSAHTGFFGSKHFSQTNQYLKNNGIKEIKW
ncbi:MAG: uracil-DNA glycosylase [Candidatus Paceibacterota bacterium]